MVTFLDIEGAFNNVTIEAIGRSVSAANADLQTQLLIMNLIRHRKVTASLGTATVNRWVERGTPQGGVLSPLLWKLVVNDILLELERDGYSVVAYADEVAIAVVGKYPHIMTELMERGLSKISK